MSIIKEKAKENLESAQLLVENNKLSASIHCYYYACFQISKCILNDIYKLDYKTQQETCNKLQADSHKYIIEQLFEKMKNDRIIFKAIKLQKDINLLRKERVKADYNDEEIQSDSVKYSKDLCYEILDFFKSQFGLNYES